MSAVAVGAVEAVTKDGCVLNVAGALVANWASAQHDMASHTRGTKGSTSGVSVLACSLFSLGPGRYT